MTITPPFYDISSKRPTGGNTYIVGEGEEFTSLHRLDEKVLPGDIIRIKAGHYNYERFFNSGGDIDNPLWIEAYGDGDVIYKWHEKKPMYFMKDNVVLEGGMNHQLKFTNTDAHILRIIGKNIIFHQLEVFGAGSQSSVIKDHTGIHPMGSNAQILNCYLHDNLGQGTYYATVGNDEILEGLLFAGNTVKDNGGSGFQSNPHAQGANYIGGSNIVECNYFENNGFRFDKSNIVLTPQIAADQLKGMFFIANNYCTLGENANIKINYNGDCVVFVQNNISTRARGTGLLQSKNAEAPGLVSWIENHSFGNGRDVASHHTDNAVFKNNIIGQPRLVPDWPNKDIPEPIPEPEPEPEQPPVNNDVLLRLTDLEIQMNELKEHLRNS